jgi:hypothetical protein
VRQSKLIAIQIHMRGNPPQSTSAESSPKLSP